MRISFLAPRLPPAVCGIADHTRLLAEAFTQEGVEVGFIHHERLRSAGRILPGPIDCWDRSGHDLQRCVAPKARLVMGSIVELWLLPLGCSARAGEGSSSDALPGVAVAICAHETHCQPQQLGRKGPLLSPWQHHTVAGVVRQADIVFTSIAKYVRQIIQEYKFPSAQVVHLAIGSSLPQIRVTSERHARMRQALGWTADDVVAVTFGSFGSQLRALRNCHEHLARGLRAGHLQRIVCVGGVNRTPPSELTAFGDHFGGPRRFQVLGHRPERTVAKVLECSDFAFSAYPRGLLGKSTAFSAFALAGLPVLVANAGSGEACDLDEPPFLRADSWDWSQANSPEVAACERRFKDLPRPTSLGH